MAEHDIIIKGGTIVDGTRTPRYVSDIAIKDGKIAKIGGLVGSTADRVLEAQGLIVAPGFVDLHTHYDAQIQWDPYCTLSGWHGVTSVAIGNCGFGFAPSRVEDQERSMLSMTRNEAIPYAAMREGMLWDWVTFPEFMSSLERVPKGVNCLTYVPLTPLYAWVMGWDAAKTRRPTEAELQEMVRLIHEAMDAGACGWSAQVLGDTSVQRDYDGTPMITDLLSEREILTFAKILADRDEGLIELAYQETGEEGRPLAEGTMHFFEQVALTAKRPVLYQAVTPNAVHPEQHRARLRWLARCAQQGIRVFGQGATRRGGFDLTFEDWNLFDDTAAWREVTLGTPAERKAKMQDPEMRRRLREEWDAGTRPTLVVQAGVGSLTVVETVKPELQHYSGHTVQEIADDAGKHLIDALLDLVVAADMGTQFHADTQGRNVAQYTAEVLDSPVTIAGVSDGGAHVKFLTGGSYATELLTWLVRDEKVMSLEDAHYKLSYLPAFLGGFKDRGFLREGAPADIVVYDMDQLEVLPSEIAEDLPGGEWRRIQKAKGYNWILVNGQVTFQDGEPTGALPGKFLRH
ncbi:MAG TPA: amidohydrolase family protein, partial [Candidatus Saccharimonadia bacterium]|nr:amidohydrolase family protein [Candidatus Saccharimonadia bacterium]